FNLPSCYSWPSPVSSRCAPGLVPPGLWTGAKAFPPGIRFLVIGAQQTRSAWRRAFLLSRQIRSGVGLLVAPTHRLPHRLGRRNENRQVYSILDYTGFPKLISLC
ncbi:unnamed protein product, partial [Mycena citricolor]